MQWHCARWIQIVTLLVVCVTGCRSIEPRAASGFYECLRTVRDQALSEWPALTDKQQHCVVSARIARQCSIGEAYLAGLGKEIADLFGAGDAEWRDWQADRQGVRCSRQFSDDAQLLQCCAVSLPSATTPASAPAP